MEYHFLSNLWSPRTLPHPFQNPKTKIQLPTMFEQQSLIPNLNEIMEEYAGSEGKAALELQTMVIEEEMLKERAKIGEQVEEGRKRKRAEERETDQEKEDKAD